MKLTWPKTRTGNGGRCVAATRWRASRPRRPTTTKRTRTTTTSSTRRRAALAAAPAAAVATVGIATPTRPRAAPSWAARAPRTTSESNSSVSIISSRIDSEQPHHLDPPIDQDGVSVDVDAAAAAGVGVARQPVVGGVGVGVVGGGGAAAAAARPPLGGVVQRQPGPPRAAAAQPSAAQHRRRPRRQSPPSPYGPSPHSFLLSFSLSFFLSFFFDFFFFFSSSYFIYFLLLKIY